MVRAGGRCEWCREPGGALDPEHAHPTGRGGSDTWANVWLVHREPCHRLKTFGTRATEKLEVTPVEDMPGVFFGQLWRRGVLVTERTFGRVARPEEQAVLA